MTAPTAHRGIVVGVDGSPVSKPAVSWAARDAAMRNVPLTVVNIDDAPLFLESPAGPTNTLPMQPEYLRWRQNMGREILDEAVKIVEESTKQLGPVDVNAELMNGLPIPTLVDLSREAEMVVVGSHGRGALARVALGSVSIGLAHHAHCPVAIIRGEVPLVPDRSKSAVVVGIDGSPASESAITIAFDEASFRGVELVAVHAWSDMGDGEFPGVDWSTMQSLGEATLSERLAGRLERYPDVEVRRVVVPDRPTRELVQQSDSAQLVIVGSRGRGGFARMLLGSVSTSVAQAARAPVIVARSGSIRDYDARLPADR